MNKTLTAFVQKLNAGEREFEINNEKTSDYCVFMSRKNGNAVYYYGYHGYKPENYISTDGVKYELCAILSDGKIYLIRFYPFHIGYGSDGEDFPENVCLLSDFVKSCNAYLNGKSYADFYNIIVAEPAETDVDRYDTMKFTARRLLIGRDQSDDPYSPSEKLEFTADDAARMLVYGNTLDIAVGEILDANYEKIKRRKENNLRMEKEISDGKLYAPWEETLADAIRDNDAKTLTAVFSLHGKTATEKISRDELIRVFCQDAAFSKWNFPTRGAGEKLYESLGASDSCRCEPENTLRLQNIVSLSYRGKPVYTRPET